MPDKLKSKNLNILNHFVGYGNPYADYYFIGIEEHSPDKKNKGVSDIDKKRLEIYKQNFIKYNKPYHLTNDDFKILNEHYEYNLTYDGIVKIFNTFSPSREIKPQDIGDSNINLFIANLYPLGRSTTNDNYNDFIKEFVFDNDFKEWHSTYWHKRKKILKDFFKKYLLQEAITHKYIFCLGITERYTFEILFKELLEDNFEFEICNQGNNRYYGIEEKNNLTFYCLYHPASRQFKNLNFKYDNGFKIIL